MKSLNDETIRPETLPRIKLAAISDIVKENRSKDIHEVSNMIKGFMIEKNIPYQAVMATDGEIILHLEGTSYHFNHSKEFKNHVMS